MTMPIQRGRLGFRTSPIYSVLLLAAWIAVSAPADARADFYTHTLMLMEAKFETIRDYRCLYRAYSAANGKSTDVSFEYFFMKPKKIRMETVNGKYPGTVLLYDAEQKPEKVKVRVGSPFLALMQKAIYGDYFHHRDKRVTDLGGFGVLESDWGWFIDIHRRMDRYGRTDVKKMVEFNGRPALYYRLISTDPEQTMSIASEEIWIDPASYVPLKFVEYDRHGNVIRKGEYQNMAVDVGLTDDLFNDFDANGHRHR